MKIRIALATFAGVATMAMLGAAVIAPSASAATTTKAPVVHVVPMPPGPGDLSAKLSPPVVKGQNVSFVLTLTNVSRHAVVVSGFPGLKLLDIFRHPLPTKTVPVMSPFIHKVVLFPGHSATAKISFVKFGPFFHWSRFIGPKAAFLQVTLPGAPMPWSHHGFAPPVRFTLWIPGGPWRVVHNTLYETALTGMPFFRW